MNFDVLDKKMRIFETAHDDCVLPGIYMVARIDGRSFTRLTKVVQKFQAPFDERFRDMMLTTTESLVTEFRAIYGYTQSDEISLLLPLKCDLFSRKLRKLNSVLAGHASAVFSLALGSLACMDCRICELPTTQNVVDYFRWRQEDSSRNALNAHCYWLLRKQGKNATLATRSLERLTVSDKNELLFQNGINFNQLPVWQRRGSGVFWSEQPKEGLNPKTGKKVIAMRSRLSRNMELPMKDQYSRFIEMILQKDLEK